MGSYEKHTLENTAKFFVYPKFFLNLPQKFNDMGIIDRLGFIFPLFRNKYSLSLIVFFVYIVFFDANNLIDRAVNQRRVHRLQKEILFYNEKIKDDRAKLEELESNPANLEKFAREQFLMKRDNEDVFIIE